jgi:hypothetical protein
MSTRRTLACIVAAVSLGATSSALAEGRIHRRQENQQQRIAQGVRSGQLTARETARLETRESALNREIHALRQSNGGPLTPAERALVERQQDRLSRGIYRQKHDAQLRH